MSKAEQVRIWDIWVRLFHWSFAISVVFMLISGGTGWLFFDWHRTIGEWVMNYQEFWNKSLDRLEAALLQKGNDT